jgi:hypothetical protein
MPTASPSFVRRALRGLVRGLVSIPVAIWLLAEEWLWDAMLRLMARLAKLPAVAWVEAKIARLPRYAALIAFVLPAAVLLPFKLVAFWLIAKGYALLGAVVFVAAKIVGTAFLARIFALTKPALLTFNWFRRSYEFFMRWKERLYAMLRALPLVIQLRAWMRAVRMALKRRWQHFREGRAPS